MSMAAAYRSPLFFIPVFSLVGGMRRSCSGSAVGEQPGEVRVAGCHVDLRPEPVVVEGRSGPALQVRVELGVVRVVLVEGPDVEEGHPGLDHVAIGHLASPALRNEDTL